MSRSEEPLTPLERLLNESEWVDGNESIWVPLRAEAVRDALHLDSPPPEKFEVLVERAVREERHVGSTPGSSAAGSSVSGSSVSDDSDRSGEPAAGGIGRWGLIAAGGVVAVGVGLVGTAAYALLNHEQAVEAAQGEQGGAPAQAETSELTLRGDGELPAADASEGEGITATVDTMWADTLAAEADIPFRAMRAYAGAAIRAAEEYPGCGLGWNTLAGIGFVESEHGALGGGHIDADGQASPRIIGIPLDGTSTDRIPDTDGGALDGDSAWDRAVGPMQFIPSTWETWGTDGSGDGTADPQNIDDAAYSAARYLCATGGDLRDPQNWISAVAAYNNTVEYNNRVAEAADHYAALADAAD